MRHGFTRRRFFALGGAALAVPRAARAADAELSFIQLTDTHVSTRRLVDRRQGYDVPAAESVRRTKAVVQAINECALPYRFIVHTGDVAHTRDTDEDFDLARDLLQFDKPAYYMPGNHDVGYSQTPRFIARFEEHFGKSNRALEPVDGVRIVTIDSQPLDNRAPDEDREETFRTLDRLLAPAKPTILCCHVMGIASFHVNRMWPGWPEETMLRWITRMKEGGVFAVLCGHFHREEMHTIHGLPFYLAGPVVNFWGRQTSFRHWTLSEGALTYRSVYLEL